jgi:hypothetical protein
MSASRYDARRLLIVQESNDIGSVISLCDMYPDANRTLFRKDLKEYVETRISYYNTTESEVMNNSIIKSQQISSSLWKSITISAKQQPDFTRDNQMIPMSTIITEKTS